MTVKELRDVLDNLDPFMTVKVCVNTPAGWMCPDGCAIGVKTAICGMDWHMNDLLIVPSVKLDIHDISAWEKNPDGEED